MFKSSIILFLFLLTISANAQQFELMGAPGASPSVFQIAINPDNPSVLCSRNHYGIFQTEDGGQTVKAVYTPFNELYINDLQVVDKNNTIIFGSSAGYYRSNEGDNNWTIINTDNSTKKILRINPLNKNFYYIKKNNNELWRSNNKGESWYKFAAFNSEIVTFDIFPQDTSVIYLATGTQLYKTTNAGLDWNVTEGHLITDMKINPLNSNVLYILWEGSLSKSEDGGKTIKEIIPSGVASFILNPADTSIIFAGVGYTMDSQRPTLPSGIYKSIDGGRSWETKMNGIDTSMTSYGSPILAIAINPNNKNEVYIGLYSKGVLKTTDGGDNWQVTHLSYMAVSHLSTYKDNPNDIFVGNFGWGVMKTTDGGGNWYYPYFDIEPSLIAWTERCFDFNPENKMEGFLAGSNCLYNTSDGGASWYALKNINYVNYGAVFFHKYSPNIVFLLANQGPFISTDFGSTWAKSEGGRTSNHIRFVKKDKNLLYDYDYVNIVNDSYKFIAKKSTDLGKTWIEINNGLSLNAETHKNLDIKALEPDINNPDIVYCGQRGGLSKTTNGGVNWFQVDSSLKVMEPRLSVTSILLDPNKSNRMYVGIRGGGVEFTEQYTQGGLYLTEDDCKTWRRVFNGQVLGIYSDEGNPRNVFINTYQGVIRFLDTLTVTDVKDIQTNIAESFGLAQNYPNPFNPTTTINYSIPTSSYVTLKVYDVLGNEVAVLVNEWQETGSYTAQFSTSGKQLQSGVYFYQLRAGNFAETKKCILLK